MNISGVELPMMNQAIQSFAGIAGSVPLTQTSVATNTTPGRLQQLVQLINTFTPAEIMTALLLANTTYLQSEAPVSVTAAEIRTQLSNQVPVQSL